MELALPSNSFDNFVPPVAEDNITIIEIGTSYFKYGFGFSPLQPRIKSK
jgi:hypothetical protein